MKIFVSALALSVLFKGPSSCAEESSQSSARMIAETPFQLNSRSARGLNPDVSASADGRHIFAVWEGESHGNRRIFLRESFNGVWLPEIIVDANPSMNNSNPSVAVDVSGRPHVAWIATIAGRRVPLYAHRASRQPHARWSIHELLPRQYPEVGDCDYVTVECDTSGAPWIAWQSGFGSTYSIFTAHPGGAGGSLEISELTPLATGPNLYPEILISTRPVILWYTATEGSSESPHQRYTLAAKRHNFEQEKWETFSIENFDLLDANALPFIIQKNDSRLTAVWYTNNAGEYSTTASNDRILIGEQGPKTRGAGTIIDNMPMQQNREVAAVVDRENYMAAWTAQMPDGFSDIIAGYGNLSVDFETVTVTSTLPVQVYSAPQIERLGNTGFALVWQAESTGAVNDGAIYYARVSPKDSLTAY